MKLSLVDRSDESGSAIDQNLGVREMVADLDRRIGLKWLAWETCILTLFQ
ncbi:hypothetical protein MRS76_23815 [Rhizobiaceae bacterium n13]|nr:hypothetical protein [Fererhizobium litorale]MDI7864957.1 hypothetical protein [Fererhizobium litorale]